MSTESAWHDLNVTPVSEKEERSDDGVDWMAEPFAVQSVRDVKVEPAISAFALLVVMRDLLKVEQPLRVTDERMSVRAVPSMRE